MYRITSFLRHVVRSHLRNLGKLGSTGGLTFKITSVFATKRKICVETSEKLSFAWEGSSKKLQVFY